MDELRSSKSACEFVETDLGQVEECAAAIRHIEQRYGRIDGLVNNAGVNDGVSLAEGSPLGFERSLQANLLHCYALAHYALPLLKASKGTCLAGFRGSPGRDLGAHLSAGAAGKEDYSS